MNPRLLLATAAFTAALLIAAGGPASASPAGYPTELLADYVFGCMATNGQTPDALRRCSCSIDRIGERVTYDEYVQAETILRMQQVPGGDDRIAMYRTAPWATAMVDKLRQAQAEAEARCF
ncbi:MAG TPA: hypothetical protein VF606_08610 [Geminicoccaceae bacterium]|jgi:hypothetical protein